MNIVSPQTKLRGRNSCFLFLLFRLCLNFLSGVWVEFTFHKFQTKQHNRYHGAKNVRKNVFEKDGGSLGTTLIIDHYHDILNIPSIVFEKDGGSLGTTLIIDHYHNILNIRSIVMVKLAFYGQIFGYPFGQWKLQ